MHCYAKGKSLLKLDELKDQACKRLRDVYFKLLGDALLPKRKISSKSRRVHK